MIRTLTIISCSLFILVGCSKNQETIKPNNDNNVSKPIVTNTDKKDEKVDSFKEQDIKSINIRIGEQFNLISTDDSRYKQIVSLTKKVTNTNGAMCKCGIQDSEDLIKNHSNGKVISIEFNKEVLFTIKYKYAVEHKEQFGEDVDPYLIKTQKIYLLLDDSSQQARLYDSGLYELDDLTISEELNKLFP